MSYDQIRFKLFTLSFIGTSLISALRKKYGIKRTSDSVNWLEKNYRKNSALEFRLLRERHITPDDTEGYLLFKLGIKDEIIKIVTPEISRLASMLKLDEDVLRHFIITGELDVKLKRQYYLHTYYRPIKSDGYYIRVDESTTLKDVKNAYSGIRNTFKKYHSKTSHQRKDISKMDQKKTNMQILIEESIIKFSKERNKPNPNGLKQYKKELVGAAIERMIGNFLSKRIRDDDDSEYQIRYTQLYKRLHTWYYEVNRRYNLPTPMKLEQLLRLINS